MSNPFFPFSVLWNTWNAAHPVDTRPTGSDVYGAVLPLVYGTARAKGLPVFMANKTTGNTYKWEAAPGSGSNNTTPNWVNNKAYAVGDWVVRNGSVANYYRAIRGSAGGVDARTPEDYPNYWLYCGTDPGRWYIKKWEETGYYGAGPGSTSGSLTNCVFHSGKMLTWPIGQYDNVPRIVYFHTGPNAGLARYAHRTASTQYTIVLAEPFPFNPNTLTPGSTNGANGDVFSVFQWDQSAVAAANFALCEAPVSGIVAAFRSGYPTLSASNFEKLGALWASSSLVTDAATTWAPMEGYLNPAGVAVTKGMTMSGTVQARFNALALDNGKIPDIKFTVQGFGYDGISGSPNAHPADVIRDLCKRLPTPLDGHLVTEVGPDGAVASSYRNWCTAMDFGVSRYIDQGTPAKTLLDQLLNETGATIVWSEGNLKVIPLGDAYVSASTSQWGTSLAYSPPTASYLVTQNDILHDGRTEPILIERSPEEDIFNSLVVSFDNPAYDYGTTSVEYTDTGHVTSFGLRRGQGYTAKWVPDSTYAKRLASILVRRSINIRNSYSFRLPARFALLDPMDFLTFSDTRLGLNSVQLRISEIEEQSDGSLKIRAYEWPTACTEIVDLPQQSYDGYKNGINPTEASNTATDAWTAAIVNATEISGTNVAVSGAQVTASLAQEVAVSASVTASLAQETASQAYDNAQQAWLTGSQALSSASIAQASATLAQQQADLAYASATLALNSASLADANADLALLSASLAQNSASLAQATADLALVTGTLALTIDISGSRIVTNTLDASKIVAGSITTDRMTANSINGDRITANTLDAAKIVAGSITTDRMTANTINGDRITAGTLTADKLVANSITAGQLAAGSVTANKLTLVDTNNLWPNGTSELAPPTGVTTASNPEFEFRTNAYTPYAGSYCRYLPNGSLTYQSVPAQAGDVMHFSVMVSGAYQILLISGPSTQSTIISGTATTWTNVTASLTLTNQNTTNCGAYISAQGPLWLDNIVYKKKTALIVDGAISASHIAAGAVTAQKLDANAIQTSNYAYSGTINTTSEYATAGAKMQASGTALLVAPGNFKIGDKSSDTFGWIVAKGVLELVVSGSTVSSGTRGLHGISNIEVGVGGDPYTTRLTFTSASAGHTPITDVSIYRPPNIVTSSISITGWWDHTPYVQAQTSSSVDIRFLRLSGSTATDWPVTTGTYGNYRCALSFVTVDTLG